MHRSGKSRNKEKKAFYNQLNYYSTITAVQKIPGAAKIETRITHWTNSTSPAHSVNNAKEGMIQRRPLTTDVPSIQVQLTGPHPNQLDLLCREGTRVHKVQIAQEV